MLLRRRFADHLLLAVTISAAVSAPAFGAPKGRLTGRAFAPNERIRLDGGEEVSAARYEAELSQLHEALQTDGVSLKKSDGRPPTGALPLYKGAHEEKLRDRALLQQKREKLAGVEKGGFAALLKKRAAIAGGTRAPVTGLVKGPAANAPSSDDDALDVAYTEMLGSKKRAAISVSLSLRDAGTKDAVGCDAAADGGVYLFDGYRSLVKVNASGKVTSTGATGTLDLYVLGKSVDGFPKKGAANANLTKAIAPPAVKMQYGWGPLSIAIEGSIAGEIKLPVGNAQEAGNASQTGRCSLNVDPQLRATAKASASVNAVAYKVGVQGQIVLVDIQAPMAAAVRVKKSPSAMTEDFKAAVHASFLDGDAYFFVKTRIPQDGEHWWDLDWDQVYKKSLFDWDGLRIDSNLASFTAKETSL